MDRVPRPISSRPIPPGLRGRWAALRFPVRGAGGRARLTVVFTDLAGADMPGGVRLHPGPEAATTLCFVPPDAAAARVERIGQLLGTDAPLEITPLPRWQAALRLVAREPRRLRVLLPPWPRSPAALIRQLRLSLIAPMHDEAEARPEYQQWVTFFDTWSPAELPPVPDHPSVGVLLLAPDRSSPAAARSLASLAALHVPAPRAVAAPDAWREAVAALDTDHVGLLGPGEVLPPWSIALARRELARSGRPALAIADEDSLDADGGRAAPVFRPRPNRALMLTGTLATGLWLVRRDVLLRHAADAPSAEAFRLALWFAFHEATGEDGGRIPYVLSHRTGGAEAAPPETLAAPTAAHVTRAGLPFEVEAATPLRLTLLRGAASPPVTAMVPSTLRPAHALRCIRAILTETDHPDFRVEVGVSQPQPLDEAQRRVAAEIEAHPNAKVTWLPAPRFNFSWVNNRLAERFAGREVLLLNDDVSPIAPDWLRRMGAWLADPKVGAVGARLLYPTGRVQHGGVILGLAGLCDHAHRDLPGDDPGYAQRAVLPQELSAVTAACMLVRRAAYDAVGGMDESYPSAFNDVDLCLRIREGGYRVIYDGAVSLHHHELQTYGNHYGGERAAFHAGEVARMRSRWAGVVAADPFHSPNLSLEFGREWQLAFPPRTPGPEVQEPSEPSRSAAA